MYPAKPLGVLFQFGERLLELGLSAIDVAQGLMVATDGCLDQPLIEQPQRAPGLPPQVFPGLVGFKILSFIEKIYTDLEEI